MKTIDQYFPAMSESAGRLFYVPRAGLHALVAVAALAGGLAYAIHYPAMKTAESTARLDGYNSLITGSTAATSASVSRTLALVSGMDAGIQSSVKTGLAPFQTRLAAIRPITLDEVHTAVEKRRDAYAAAQVVIAASPFRGTPVGRIPASAEGKAYLDALKVTPPPLRAADQIDLAADQALGIYKSALDLQAQMADVEHRVDGRVNGDKAKPEKTVVVPADLSQLDARAAQAREALPIDTSASPAPSPAPVSAVAPAPAPAAPAVQAVAPVQVPTPAPAVAVAPQPAVDQQAQAQRQQAVEQAKERAAQKREQAAEAARERAQATQQTTMARQQQQAAAARQRVAPAPQSGYIQQGSDGYIQQ